MTDTGWPTAVRSAPTSWRPTLSDVDIYVTATLCALGARVGQLVGAIGCVSVGFVGIVGGACVARACGRRRVVGLSVSLAVLGFGVTAWSQRAWHGLRSAPEGRVLGRATVVQAPDWIGGALRVRVRVNGNRVEMWLRGPDASRAAGLALGQRVDVEGSTRRLRNRTPSQVSAHIGASLDSAVLGRVYKVTGIWGVADSIARRIERASQELPTSERALYMGLVVGDDSDQTPAQRAVFRRAGLGHLLAVSGQNVAFVVAVCLPLVASLRPGQRGAVLIAVIALFALVTRLEPSVIRASVMASAALWARARGSPQAAGRVLGLSVIVLTWVDPLLWWSVGFQLSVAATAGLIWLAPPLQRLLGGGTVAQALGLAVAAPLATLPLTLAVFGTSPLVAIPANLLAGVPAGWAMSIGLVCGLVVPSLPAWLAAPLVWSTTVSVGAVERIAWFAARAGWPEVEPTRRGGLLVVAVVCLLLLLGHRTRDRRGATSADRLESGAPRRPVNRRARVTRRVLTIGALVCLCGAAIGIDGQRAEMSQAAADCGVRVLADRVVVLDDLDVECAASVLVSRGWRVLPIAIVTSGNRTARRRAGELFSAMPPALVYSAPHDSVHRWVGEISVTAPIRLRLGDVDLQIRVVGERLDVQAAPRAPPASERPGSP